MTMHGYVERAQRYARAVVDGDQIACELTRLACERHLRDLERAESDPAWPYRFDLVRAERPCLLIECLPHVKGKWRTATIELED